MSTKGSEMPNAAREVLLAQTMVHPKSINLAIWSILQAKSYMETNKSRFVFILKHRRKLTTIISYYIIPFIVLYSVYCNI